MCIFLACMRTTCVTDAHVDQMRALDALEVEFQVVVSSLNLGLLARASEPSFQPHILHFKLLFIYAFLLFRFSGSSQKPVNFMKL